MKFLHCIKNAAGTALNQLRRMTAAFRFIVNGRGSLSKELRKRWKFVKEALLVLVPLATMMITCQQMREEGSLTRESNKISADVANFSVRPFAHMWASPPDSTSIAYYNGDLEKEIRDGISVNDVIIGSEEYKRRSSVVVELFGIEWTLHNRGKLPLYIKFRKTSAVRESRWVDSLGKSVDELVQYIIKRYPDTAKSSIAENDVLVLPDSSFKLQASERLPIQIPLREFESARDSGRSLIVYPYTYIRYEDPFGREYDVLLVMCTIHSQRKTDDTTEVKSSLVKYEYRVSVLEKLRFDLVRKGEVSSSEGSKN